jgi:cyclopropane fatty-acyl-phospholipid synthase-like methyltransferase
MITEEYKKILTELNGVGNFGKRKKIPRYLPEFIDNIKPSSILDFGCGSGNLISTISAMYPNMTVDGYDPGNGFYRNPIDDNFYDLIISTDVLEHVEPNFIDDTLKFLSTKSKYAYHLIALAPSTTFLPDGRNAHLILETPRWWKEKFLNLDYTVVNEVHMKHTKLSKKTGEPTLVDKYFLMLKKN